MTAAFSPPRPTAQDFAEAQAALLPPGAAWHWPVGGKGRELLAAMGQEPARVCAAVPEVLDAAVEQHTPKAAGVSLDDYRAAAVAAAGGNAAAVSLFWGYVPLHVGFKVGDACWSSRSRFILRLNYNPALADPAQLMAALLAMRQAHISIWLFSFSGVFYAAN